ncbi:MAG: SDR family oxidoreductase [Nitrospirae bacterium]|nr:SDR family oxidoreductase [Candidatus Troglogloeales bacterium]MBI3598633.1 SDR family oxidoreductase [Candidatus Troglogloeales bacterium]
MDLNGKSVLITGAGRRIGAGLAKAIAARGAKIGIHYNRSKKEAASVAKAIEKQGGTVFLTQGDISDVGDCGRIIAETARAFGGLHVLINNAAVFFKTPLLQTTEKDWDQTLDTNLKGAFFCAQAAAKIMQKNGGREDRALPVRVRGVGALGASLPGPHIGSIINIADWAAIRPYTDYLPYCISKAGIVAMTKGLARTLAPKITVNCVAPGPILLPEDFDKREKKILVARTPLKRIGAPEDIINAVLFLLEGTDFMTGSTIVVDGGRLIA